MPWVMIPGDSGHDYYWNTVTDRTQYDEPAGAVEWRAQQDTTSGLTYYWNVNTRVTTWNLPKAPESEPLLRAQAAPPAIPAPARLGAAVAAAPAGLPRGCAPVAAAAASSPAAPGLLSGAALASLGPRPASGWQFDVVWRGRLVPEVISPNPQDASSGEQDAAEPSQSPPQGPGAPAFCEAPPFASPPREWEEAGAEASLAASSAEDGPPPYYRSLHRGGTYHVELSPSRSMPELPNKQSERSDSHEARPRRACPAGAQHESWIENDSAMALVGLRSGERYNGQGALVLRFEGEFVVVRLAEQLGETSFSVRPANLEPLRENSIVEFRGLQKETELNGQVATVIEIDYVTTRYRVKLAMEPSVIKLVKANRVVPRCPLWEIDLTMSTLWLQWRKEQNLLFIDKEGYHHHYWLHLPLGFSHWLKASRPQPPGERPRPWPALLYLHGTGGSSFFTHSKKTLRSVGLQHAADKFVVVSPQCDWTWKDMPSPWVLELIRCLRAADWIDHRRVYLSGCSMGGMGTWELGALAPDIFAAIAPVAAHHRADRNLELARLLRDTPIFAVHSVHDETCGIGAENGLWAELHAAGNDRMQVNMVQGIDHCSMYERAYCDDTQLYRWLLAHKRRGLRAA